MYQHLICQECSSEKKILDNQLIEVEEIIKFDLNSGSPLQLFPIHLNRNISQMIKQVESQELKMMEEVQSYFKKLLSYLNQAIQVSIKKQKERVDEIAQLIKLTDANFLSKNSIKQLQLILTSQEYKKIDQELHFFIQQHLQSTSRQQIEINLNNILEQQKKFSSELAISIQQDILTLVEKIQFFNQPSESSSSLKVFDKKSIKSILDSSSFCKASDYNKSNQLEIETIKNKITIKNSENGSKQCYLENKLENSKKYSFIVTFDQKKKDHPYFALGLIRSQDKDTIFMGESCDIFFHMLSEYYYNKRKYVCQTAKVLKGGRLDTVEKTQGARQFEVRVDLSKKQWKVSSYPDYSNVCEMEYSYLIDSNNTYHFCIYLQNSGDSVTIEDILEVNCFDNAM